MENGISDKVAIIGTGITRFGELWDKDTDSLIVDAVYEACAEANVDLKKDVDAAWLGASLDTTGFAGDALADPLALYGRPVSRVANYCCTGMDTVRNAAYAIAAGAYDIVLACGVEKLLDLGGTGLPVEPMFPHPTLVGQSAPAIFAAGAKLAFREWGWTREDLGRVAVKNHYNGAKHPKAHFRREINLDIALNAPMISDPLGVFDCCAVSDGAAAVILTRPEIARDRVGSENFATIKAMGQAIEAKYPFYNINWNGLSFPATVKAVKAAYREAGVQDPVKELDFGLVHDCFTIAEMIHYQDFGLCKPGEAADLVKQGFTAIDGEFPINPDGGLKCFGHPVGATGCRMIAEITRQVLGKAEGYQVKGAKAGFAHNIGGAQSVAMVSIVGTEDWEPGGRSAA